MARGKGKEIKKLMEMLDDAKIHYIIRGCRTCGEYDFHSLDYYYHDEREIPGIQVIRARDSKYLNLIKDQCLPTEKFYQTLTAEEAFSIILAKELKRAKKTLRNSKKKIAKLEAIKEDFEVEDFENER